MSSPAAVSPDASLCVDDIREHYDRLSSLYRTLWGEHIHHGYWLADESSAEAQINLTRELARRAAIRGGERILDIGCGLGGSALLLAELFGCQVKGISLSPQQIRAATKEARRRGLQNRATFVVQDANDLGANESGQYDVVWIIECSEHVFEKARFVAACADRLKPGGRLAVCAWLSGANLDASRRQLVDEVLRGMLCPSFGTLKNYTEWMEEAGLTVLSAEDVTRRVERTWELCQPLLRHPLVQPLLALGDSRLQEFARSFRSIHDAYRTDAMAYGMIVAQKPVDSAR